MEVGVASCLFCGSRSVPAITRKTLALNVRRSNSNVLNAVAPLQFSFCSSFRSICLFIGHSSNPSFAIHQPQQFICNNSYRSSSSTKSSTSTKKRPRTKSSAFTKSRIQKTKSFSSTSTSTRTNVSTIVEKSGVEKQREQPKKSNKAVNVRTLYQNGDPLGRRDLGKSVVKWICQGMRAMASDFASAEVQGEFSELRQRMGPGLTFVIQAQPYLNAIPMPLGLEAICLKACTHYPTLFDHFQRELRDVLQELQQKSLVQNWHETESWKLLKELANSGCFFSFANTLLFF